jgi:PQQ-dependent dehydrogenase (s-GDH family)
MKAQNLNRKMLLFLALIICIRASAQTYTVNGQVFKVDTLYPASGTTGLNAPWEITYGPDDSLWVTEAKGYKVWKINPRNKGSRSVLDVSADKNFSDAAGPWPQGGLMGLTIHPDFNAGKRYVYLAYVYELGSCPSGAPCYFSTKIVRYDYPTTGINRYKLTNAVTIVSGLPGSNDHNSGRMAIGPDLKLYYTIGDMGAGQFNNASRANRAQDTTVYEGKILRFNTEPDAAQSGGDEWIPDDNPFPGGAAATAKNAIYSYGHRNAQGIVWANVAGTWRLYSSEHGDKSDDEINIIVRKGNYGWPRVAGLSTDNNYSNVDAYANNNRLANMVLNREDTFYTNNTSRGLLMREPMKSLFAQPASSIKADGSDIYTWWTIAPSSIDFYGSYSNTIPGWENSILVPSLKQGLYRIALSASGNSFFGDTIRYMVGNRIRDMAINPHGDTLYFVNDRSGSTSGPTGGFSGADIPTGNPGYILRMVFLNGMLSKQTPKPAALASNVLIKIYPNPATKFIYVDTKSGLPKPLRYQLLDLTGKLLIEETSATDSYKISLERIVPGLYIFKIYDGNGTTIRTEKLMIK